LLYVLLVPLSAQESAAGSADDLASRTLRFRIASATLYELRDLAAEYGCRPREARMN
jgi:hypothetical protein